MDDQLELEIYGEILDNILFQRMRKRQIAALRSALRGAMGKGPLENDHLILSQPNIATRD